MFSETSQHDLKSVAHCHRSAFPGSFSSALGIWYLKKMFDWFLSTDKTFLFHINENGKCIGYCGGLIVDGTLSTDSTTGKTHHSHKEAIISLMLRPWLLFHPHVRKNSSFILKNLKNRFGAKNKKNESVQKKKKVNIHAGLVVIGVNPTYQGKGYGSKLLNEFERRSIEDYGISTFTLSVMKNNSKAISAYERNGWKRRKIVGESLKMYKEVKNEKLLSVAENS